MSRLNALYLDSIRRAVTEDLLPELQTDMARHRVELINMILARLMMDESGMPAMLRELWTTRLHGLKTVLRDLPPDHPARNQLSALIQSASQPPGEDLLVPAWDERLAEAVQSLLLSLARDPAESGSVDGAAHRTKLIGFLSSGEDTYRQGYEGEIAAILAQKQARSGEDGQAVNAATLTSYLAGRFPEEAGIRAENVRNIPGGRSKATIMFDLVSERQGVQNLVMRKDFPINFLRTAIVDEYPLLDRLAALNAPVAKPVWVEPDDRHFGTAFMVSEKVTGKTAGNLFAVAEASPAAGLELARVLAFFHRLDLDDAGIAAHVQFGRSSSSVHDLVAYWYHRWKEGATTPSVILESAFTWLRDHMGWSSPLKRLVHGDAGIHNLMIDGDRVTALLDWEFAHAGDAAEDLAYCSTYVRQFMDWNTFMASYVEAGGPEVTPEQLKYWGVWSAVRNAVATNLAYRVYQSGEDRDLRVAAMGMNTYPRLLRNLAKALKGATES